jgi:hypothetical protein
MRSAMRTLSLGSSPWIENVRFQFPPLSENRHRNVVVAYEVLDQILEFEVDYPYEQAAAYGPTAAAARVGIGFGVLDSGGA